MRWALFAREYAITAAVAVVVFLVAYDNGGFAESTRGIIGIGVWWVIILVVAFGFAPRGQNPHRRACHRWTTRRFRLSDAPFGLLGGGCRRRLSGVRARRPLSGRIRPGRDRLESRQHRPLGRRPRARPRRGHGRRLDQPPVPGILPGARAAGLPSRPEQRASRSRWAIGTAWPSSWRSRSRCSCALPSGRGARSSAVWPWFRCPPSRPSSISPRRGQVSSPPSPGRSPSSSSPLAAGRRPARSSSARPARLRPSWPF